jgi:hypothetical protein
LDSSPASPLNEPFSSMRLKLSQLPVLLRLTFFMIQNNVSLNKLFFQ